MKRILLLILFAATCNGQDVLPLVRNQIANGQYGVAVQNCLRMRRVKPEDETEYMRLLVTLYNTFSDIHEDEVAEYFEDIMRADLVHEQNKAQILGWKKEAVAKINIGTSGPKIEVNREDLPREKAYALWKEEQRHKRVLERTREKWDEEIAETEEILERLKKRIAVVRKSLTR